MSIIVKKNLINQRQDSMATPTLSNDNFIQQNDYQTNRVNRPIKMRRRSPLSIILIIFIVSITIVFYIWNKICVDRLAIEVNDLTNHYENLINTNEFLKAEVNKKSSLERIELLIVTYRLGLVSPKEQPVWFKIDESRLENIQQRKIK